MIQKTKILDNHYSRQKRIRKLQVNMKFFYVFRGRMNISEVYKSRIPRGHLNEMKCKQTILCDTIY